MTRAPATIAILAWNSWETTRACLDSLRPSLGVRDQVVVVDNGSTDGTAAGLSLYPWVDVVSNPENRGFAGGCNDAAAQARHEVIIFLNNDTVLAHQWIDPLVAAFQDPLVGAAGPRSNFVSGPQLVDGNLYSTRSELRSFARRWQAEHRGQTSEATRLVGFCLAVRRSVFEQIGGFDESYGIGGFEDDDLSQRIVKAGYRLVIRHDSFVHHEGHKTFDANGLDWHAEQESNRSRFELAHGKLTPGAPSVRLSACLIVKDEEERLPACLSALDGLVDEIVIYDTGSTDRSIELARSLGATVIEGYWDDHFARARNAALDHCTGDWVLWVDADEVIRTRPGVSLKSILARTQDGVDAWSVLINNAVGNGTSSQIRHQATRLFRRERCEWAGRIHEQVVRRGDAGNIAHARLDDEVWIDHSGYLAEVVTQRNKTERNIRMAQAEVEKADGWERSHSLTSLARSLMMGGRLQEALENAGKALDGTSNPITRRVAARTALEASLELGRLEDARAWCSRLAAEGADDTTVRCLEAFIRLRSREWGAALELLDTVSPDHVSQDGFAMSRGALAAKKAQALDGMGRYGEAADQLLGAMNDEGTIDTHLGLLVDLMIRSDRPLELLARSIPAERTVLFMAQLLQLEPGVSDRVLEACFTSGVQTRHVLATASKLALQLPLERMLVWSARLRAAGYGASCPLVAVAETSEDLLERARAAMSAHAAFREPRSTVLFDQAFRRASAEQREQIRMEASVLSPDLVGFAVLPG